MGLTSRLGYSGAMDVTLAICPWVLLWNMTMTKREKFGVATAMSMGVVYEKARDPIPGGYFLTVNCSAGAASFVKMVKLPQLTGDPSMCPYLLPCPEQALT